MLSVMDPIELEGLQIFRDDEEPRKFYPLPDQPMIPADDEGNADFLFIKYLKEVGSLAEGEEAGGGFVMFRSVLNLDEERRQRVVDGLRTRLEEEKAARKRPFGHAITSTEPILASPLWSDGQVSLATFKVSETGLVRHATESVRPDLAGDLGASFAVELDDVGSEIFWSAFEDRDQQIPIVISYDLTYKARVSATMKIHAERKVIEKRVWRQARPYRLVRHPMARWVAMAHTGVFNPAAFQALAVRSQHPVKAMIQPRVLRDSIRQAILDQDIRVEIDTDDTGGGDDSVQQAMFTLATEVLSDRVIPAMFGDAQPGADDESDAAGFDLLEISAGDPGMVFDLQLDSRQTIERKVYPNGPIHLLLDGPDALASSFRELRLTDGFFSLMHVTASSSGVSFERDGIAAIQVFFDYEEPDEKNPARPMVKRSTDIVLKSEEDAAHWRFDTARRSDGSHIRSYRYRTKVSYLDGPDTVSDWVETSDRRLLISPRAMEALRVELALTAPSDMVESARVELRHRAPSGDVYSKTLELSAASDRATWFQHTGELAGDDLLGPEYEVQVTYRTGATELVVPWTRTRDRTLEIASPFRQRLVYTLRPQGSFDGVTAIAGDLLYDDPEHQYRVRGSFQLASLEAVEEIRIPVLEGGPEKVRWSARKLFADGSSEDLGSGDALPGTVWLGGSADGTVSFLEVEVLPDLLDFESDVQLAVITLSHGDQSRSFTFSKTSTAPQLWRVSLASEAEPTYDARLRFIAYDRALSSEVELTGQTDQVLVLDRAANAS
ncbi:MAG: hypothetical protein AAF604_22940 [Acidobacteriota bacterium]